MFVCSLSCAAQDWLARITPEAAKVEPEITAIRHQIHQNPELSNREEKTAALVADYLRKLGLEVKTGVAKTGVVAILRGGRPGPVIAVRADMDALPVTEATLLPFKSTVKTMFLGQEVGVMHACGHDLHTSIQLGVAAILASMRKDIPGTIKFIFQPAEEGAPPGERGGAEVMVEQGALENPKAVAVFGLHMMAKLPVGVIGYTEGPMMSAADTFEVKITGKQAHGAHPEAAVDPVVTAAQFVMALQTIRSRALAGDDPAVITVGQINGGQRHNIIPASVTLRGTIRTFTPETRKTVEGRFRAILKGVTEAAGAKGEVVQYDGIPATVNNPELTRESLPALERAAGKSNVRAMPIEMGSEDFSYFSNVVPGFFYRLGQVKPGTVSGDHHTPTFLADDSSIPLGLKAMSLLLVDYLERHK